MVVFKISIFLISLVCFSYRNISLINMTFPRMSLSKNWQSDRSSLPEVFCKRCVLRNFAIFTGKHLCQSLCNFVKQETLAQVFSCEVCEISKNTFSCTHRTTLVAVSETLMKSAFMKWKAQWGTIMFIVMRFSWGYVLLATIVKKLNVHYLVDTGPKLNVH